MDMEGAMRTCTIDVPMYIYIDMYMYVCARESEDERARGREGGREGEPSEVV